MTLALLRTRAFSETAFPISDTDLRAIAGTGASISHTWAATMCWQKSLAISRF